MHVTLVNISVIPEYIDAFIEASCANSVASMRESGNRRFDVLQSADDPALFVLYEAYQCEADAKAHKDTDHYATWQGAVEHMMAQPRRGVPYTALAPQD